LLQEFEVWNLGTEPSTDDLTVTSASSAHHYSTHNNNKSSNQKSSDNVGSNLRPSALHLPQAQPDISLLEAQPEPPPPFTIDTSHYNTSRVVINPGTPTEPTYELEKKGHTSVIRVSYPGPGDYHQLSQQQPPPPQPTVLKSFQPGGPTNDRTSNSHHSHQLNPPHHQPSSHRDVSSSGKHRSRSPPSSSAVAASVPIVQRVAPPPIRQDSAMGLESFNFVAVLGRGHFGKVS
jgi:hypothetical protein